MSKLYFVLSGLTLFMAGCSSPIYPTAPSAENAKPYWVMTPERSKFISVVGYAPKQINGDIEAQQRVALLKARQELGRMVRVRVENIVSQVQQIDNKRYNFEVNSDTRLCSIAALNLRNAKVTMQWVDPENGDLYILLELPAQAAD